MAAPARRKSADERREEILTAAVEHFADGGYHGTSTEAIAREAGISQPYLFRLFPTKKALFLECDLRACTKVLEVFRRAAATAEPGQELAAMGHAYAEELLPDRHALLMMMQGFAAAADPDIQAKVRGAYAAIVEEVGRLSGATPEEIWAFFANGMMLNVVTALDAQALGAESPIAAAWSHME